MSPLVWPILLPLWLRLDLQRTWDGAAALLDLAGGLLRVELLRRLNATDLDAAVDALTEARAAAGAAMQEAEELRVRLELRDLMEVRRSEPPEMIEGGTT